MASEVARIESWIYARLSGDGGASGLSTLVNGRIFPYIAPQKTDLAYPIVIYEFRSNEEVQGVGIHRIMTRQRYAVKVISKGAPNDAARGAADRIDILLNVAASVKDGYVFSSRRVQATSLLETDTGTTGNVASMFRHVGGVFLIECYPL